MLVSVCSFLVDNSDCYPLWETWNWAAGVWEVILVVVWYLLTPCEVCLLALPVKDLVFAMAKLNGH